MPVIAVDKPLHLTSHDVVSKARRACQTKRVGHTGTLDPLATGVLVLCVNDSTKVVQFMEADSKDYLAWVSLGAGTATLDAEGPINSEPDTEQEIQIPDPQKIKEVLAQFLGPQQQVPPQYSAIQVGGQRAYAVARAGGRLDLPARSVVIHRLELLGIYPSVQVSPKTFQCKASEWSEFGDWEPDLGAHQASQIPSQILSQTLNQTFTLPQPLGEFPTLLLRASVGSGTYLRSLARDIGAALGVSAHLGGLVRTRVGRYSLSSAVKLEDLSVQTTGTSDLDALDFPQIAATSQQAKELRQGKRPQFSGVGRHVVTLGGELVAVVDANGQDLKVVRVWN